MERQKRPYSIYRRTIPLKSNSKTSGKTRARTIYYVRFRDPQTSDYMPAVSSGRSRRDDAVRWAEAQLRDQTFLNHGPRAITFDEAAVGFWNYDTSPYIQAKLARGRSFSRALANDRAGQVRNHLSPVLGTRRVSAIRHADIENMVMSWYTSGKMTPATINRVLITVKVMFKRWVEDGLVSSNPCAKVTNLEETPKQRTIFTIPEAQRFFALPFPDPRHRAVNMLAASTGLRLGECLGLLKDDVEKDVQRHSLPDGGEVTQTYYRIDLKHNWQDLEGNKRPKWGSVGQVPLPAVVGLLIDELIELNPFGNQFVFFGATPDKPLNKKSVEISFNKFVHEIGISEATRRERNLTFHSWRHFLNSMLHGTLAGSTVRKVTRHKTEEMTANYDHMTDAQEAAVRQAQAGIVAQLTGPAGMAPSGEYNG